MNRLPLLFILVILLAGSIAPVYSQTAPDEFERANALYREGKFEEAVMHFEAIIRQGVVSAPLYFNLGNSYYRLGRIAPAILNYERARRLEPGDPDLQHNLSLANYKIIDRIEPLPELFFIQWARSVASLVSLHGITRILIVLWVLFFGTLTLVYLFPGSTMVRIARWLLAGSGTLLLLVGLLLAIQLFANQSGNDAIIIASTVTAKTSPDEQSVDAFVVHEGLRVTMSDSLSGWVKIILADGKVGWIRSTQCERI
ncbi:MAG: tetratricopeptide repeat protein [bacterium]